jgi:hypothetical protein
MRITQKRSDLFICAIIFILSFIVITALVFGFLKIFSISVDTNGAALICFLIAIVALAIITCAEDPEALITSGVVFLVLLIIFNVIFHNIIIAFILSFVLTLILMFYIMTRL